MKFACILSLVLLATPAVAQEEQSADAPTSAEEVVVDTARTIRERILGAIELPTTTQESRESGVPEERVREVLETARERQVPAVDIEDIIQAENAAIAGGASPDNFGMAVRALKDQGLRGRDLARAIHAEQAARGMKKPKMKDAGRAADGDRPGKDKPKKQRGGGA